MNKFGLLVPVFCIFAFSGCVEGPLWQTGHFAPWAKNQWEQENELAETLQRQKRELNAMVEQASTDSQIQQAASRLGEIAKRDSVLLVRLHAVSLLGKINHPAAIQHLKDATKDPDSKIRVTAIQSWQEIPGQVAIPQLQEVLGSDTDVDVRLAATKALGSFRDSRATDALSLALTDSNPAIQYRAMESLQQATGETIGSDVAAWQRYLGSQNKTSVADASETIGTLQR